MATSPDSLVLLLGSENPSADGINAITNSVQDALDDHVDNPAGKASGDVPVWNGTTWVPSNANTVKVNALQIGADTNLYRASADNLQTDDSFYAANMISAANFLARSDSGGFVFGASDDVILSRTAANQIEMGSGDTLKVAAVGLKFNDGTIQTTAPTAAAAPTPATSLPGSPTNGQTAILTDSTTAPTYNWLFQYDTAISDANKWRFLGGVPYHVNGLSLTVPRAGSYVVEIGGAGRVYSSNETQGLSITAGGASLVARAGTSGGAASPPWASTFDSRVMTGLTAAQVLTVSDIGSIACSNPYIRATPIRVA